MIYNILEIFEEIESSESYKHFVKDQLLKLIHNEENIKNYNMNHFKHFINNNIIYVKLNERLEIIGIIVANYYKTLNYKTNVIIQNHISINNDENIKKSLLDTLYVDIMNKFKFFDIYIITNEINKNYYKNNNFEDLQQSILKLNNV